MWYGITDRSGEVIIGTEDGVVKVRDIRSLSEEEAWSVQWFNDVRGTPWEPIPGRAGIEVEARVLMPEDRQRPIPVIRGEEGD